MFWGSALNFACLLKFCEQVAEKLKETRKYYALYNTLADTRTYLDREVTLLDSIQTGFPIGVLQI